MENWRLSAVVESLLISGELASSSVQSKGMIDFIGSLSDWGSIASLIGLVITVGGFWLTVYQLLKTKSASLAAVDAVSRFRDDVRKTLGISDLTKALTGIDELKRQIRSGSHHLLADRASDVRQLLVAVKEATNGLSEHEQSLFQAAIIELRGLEAKLGDQPAKESKSPVSLKRTLSNIIKCSDDLHGVLTRIKIQTGGNDHDLET